MKRPFTGRHMAATLVGFFGVVVAVNFTMAGLARSSFGGVVVDNSYVASQRFNGWLDAAEQQQALGWAAETTRRPDGRLLVALANVPRGASVSATARHPLGRLPDMAMAFRDEGGGRFVSNEALPAGRWTLRLRVEASGKSWRHEEEVR